MPKHDEPEYTPEQLKAFSAWLGKRSYKARLKRHGRDKLAEISRRNGAKGGRPRKAAAEKREREGE